MSPKRAYIIRSYFPGIHLHAVEDKLEQELSREVLTGMTNDPRPNTPPATTAKQRRGEATRRWGQRIDA